MGHEFLEVNDILTIHGRESENIILPITENESLKYVDKEKALHFIEALRTHRGTSINEEELISTAKVVNNFENPTISAEKKQKTLNL